MVLCYRSGHSVVPVVENIRKILSRCAFSWELVLVGNYIEGSDDETPQVVAELAKQSRNTHAVVRPKEGMMGWDMRTGLDAASGTFIGVIDGDEQFPSEAIVACLLKAELEDLDLVKTYRVLRGDGIYRRLLSAIYNMSFGLLFGFGLRDVNSKPKVIRRDKYELLNLQSNDWFVDAEMIIRSRELGLKIGEIPIHFARNERRNSFVRPAAVFEFAFNLLRYRMRHRA